MGPRFLSVAEVEALHAFQLKRYGGMPGLRDRGLLASAVAQAEAGFGGGFFHEFPFGMAAAYFFHLNKNHAFRDGNKRIGVLAALVFLEVNGYVLRAEGPALYGLAMQVARGEVEKAAIETFLKAHSTKV
jgi:death-on-curing protein